MLLLAGLGQFCMIRKTIGKFEVVDSFSVDYGVLFDIRNAVVTNKTVHSRNGSEFRIYFKLCDIRV